MTITISDKQKKLLIYIAVGIVIIGALTYGGYLLLGLLNPQFDPIPKTENSVDLEDPNLEQKIDDVDKIYYLIEPTLTAGDLGRANPFLPVN